MLSWLPSVLPALAPVANPTETLGIFLQITVLLVLAAAVGFVGSRLRQPLIVSFIAVGIFVGSYGLDLVRDPHFLELLAERPLPRSAR